MWGREGGPEGRGILFAATLSRLEASESESGSRTGSLSLSGLRYFSLSEFAGFSFSELACVSLSESTCFTFSESACFNLSESTCFTFSESTCFTFSESTCFTSLFRSVFKCTSGTTSGTTSGISIPTFFSLRFGDARREHCEHSIRTTTRTITPTTTAMDRRMRTIPLCDALSWHTSPEHRKDAQSESTTQRLPRWHRFEHVVPPQSTSVSSSLTRPS